MPTSHRRQTTAFTLIELLVVITIIGLLVSMLLPSLSSARNLAMRTKCLAATKQLAFAALNYGASSRGYLPSYLTTPQTGAYPYGIQVQLTSLDYCTKDLFTNKGCPEGPTTYSDWVGNYYYGTSPGTVGLGINDLLQIGYSYVNPPATSYWTNYVTYYPNQGPFTDRHRRLVRAPEKVMLSSCCTESTAGQIPVGHTAGIADAYFPGQVIPGRHNREGLPWTYYDGHGSFTKVLDFTTPSGYTSAPYSLWEWTWRTMYHAQGMDN
jgi:prepilin-type N-terminal cleavage/methylation domain-containing protein